MSLQRLIHSLKTADSRITDLCNELANLTACLETVERTLKGCRLIDVAYVDEDLWSQSELCLVDCHVTLNELAVLMDKIKNNPGARNFGWRLRAAVDLSIYGPEIVLFKDKIHKSNWALQTILNTISVSLSIRSNASQEMVLFELGRLKTSIDEALLESRRPPRGFGHNLAQDGRVARNLYKLAEAASQFHSAASSTAGTIRNRRRPNVSSLDGFPSYRRERVETFLRSAHYHAATGDSTNAPTLTTLPGPIRGLRSPPVTSSRPFRFAVPPSAATPRWSVVEDDDDGEAEFEQQFLDGLEDLAKDSIRHKQFDKAIALLHDAIQRKETARSDKGNIRRLQTQLALCHFFRNDWKQAEPIVFALARSVDPLSHLIPVVWTMLHALALAYLSTYAFDSALSMCKKAIQVQKRWAKSKGLDRRNVKGCADTTGLLATIFQMKGDYIAAEIYRRQEPEHFVYHHSSNPREFLACQCELLEGVLGDDLPDFCDYNPVHTLLGFYELYGGKKSVVLTNSVQPQHSTAPRAGTHRGGDNPSPLRTRRHQWERLELDTSKEVVIFPSHPVDESGDADDEASSPVQKRPNGDGIRRRVTRFLSTRRGQQRVSEGRDVGPTPGDPSSNSPLRRWFRGGGRFNVKRVQTVLRKRSNGDTAFASDLDKKRAKTFRVLNVPSSRNPVSTFSLNEKYAPLLDGRSISAQSLLGYHAPELPAATDTTRGVPIPLEPAGRDRDCSDSNIHTGSGSGEGHPHTPMVCTPRRRITPPVELPNNESLGTDEQQTSENLMVFRMLHQYSLVPLTEDDHPCESGQLSHFALPSQTVCDEMTAIEARVGWLDNKPEMARVQPWIRELVFESESDTTPEVPSGKVKNPGSSPVTNATVKLDTTHVRAGRDMFRRTALQVDLAAAALPESQATAFSLIASLLTSLESRKTMDAIRLQHTLALEAKLARLEKWSADSLLCNDLQAVINRIRNPVARQNEQQDSGYESMERDNCSGDDQAKGDSIMEKGSQQSRLHVTRRQPTATKIQTITSQFSWEPIASVEDYGDAPGQASSHDSPNPATEDHGPHSEDTERTQTDWAVMLEHGAPCWRRKNEHW